MKKSTDNTVFIGPDDGTDRVMETFGDLLRDIPDQGSIKIQPLDGMPKDVIGAVSESGISAMSLTKGAIKCKHCGGATFRPTIVAHVETPEKENMLLICATCGEDLANG